MQRRPTKFGAQKVTIDGIKFDSKMEGNRYKQLKLLERGGRIKDLVLQPKFELVAPYTNGNDKKIRAMAYIADFAYTDVTSGDYIIEDVKGYKTKEYEIKKKLFESIWYPYTITEIKL